MRYRQWLLCTWGYIIACDGMGGIDIGGGGGPCPRESGTRTTSATRAVRKCAITNSYLPCLVSSTVVRRLSPHFGYFPPGRFQQPARSTQGLVICVGADWVDVPPRGSQVCEAAEMAWSDGATGRDLAVVYLEMHTLPGRLSSASCLDTSLRQLFWRTCSSAFPSLSMMTYAFAGDHEVSVLYLT